ncbi:MAG: hypothetical protein ACYC27_03200 [Armatimonadota bacterium]
MQYGPLYPTITEQVDRGAGFSPWTIPAGSIGSSNDVRASSTVNILFTSDYLIVRGFGFSIPEDEEISGILVEIECCGVQILVGETLYPQEAEDETIQLYSLGLIGDNLARPGEDWPTDYTVEAFRVFGGQSAKWGLSPVAADINTDDFAVAISGHAKEPTDPGSTLLIDAVRVTVYTANKGIWQASPLGMMVNQPRSALGI